MAQNADARLALAQWKSMGRLAGSFTAARNASSAGFTSASVRAHGIAMYLSPAASTASFSFSIAAPSSLALRKFTTDA